MDFDKIALDYNKVTADCFDILMSLLSLVQANSLVKLPYLAMAESDDDVDDNFSAVQYIFNR